MKTFLKKTLIITLVLLISGVYAANAQNSKILAGAGVSYATDLNSLGITLRGDYLINDAWEAGADFTFFFEKDYTSWKAFDLNGHYVFMKNDKTTLYGLAGLNFTFWKVDFGSYSYYDPSDYDSYYSDSYYGDYLSDYYNAYDNLYSSSIGYEASGTEVGLNIGAGARINISKQLYLNGEMKYTIGNYNYLTINTGVLYNF
ncbi:MAG: outer membrane beta-barrel protein [Marinilabiliaceae bacterium]|nr:outer membrane beta-barrel protein [Marinilabiliaceae bacterium]